MSRAAVSPPATGSAYSLKSLILDDVCSNSDEGYSTISTHSYCLVSAHINPMFQLQVQHLHVYFIGSDRVYVAYVNMMMSAS